MIYDIKLLVLGYKKIVIDNGLIKVKVLNGQGEPNCISRKKP